MDFEVMLDQTRQGVGSLSDIIMCNNRLRSRFMVSVIFTPITENHVLSYDRDIGQSSLSCFLLSVFGTVNKIESN